MQIDRLVSVFVGIILVTMNTITADVNKNNLVIEHEIIYLFSQIM